MEYNNESNATVEELYELYLTHPHICTDSRKVRQGDIFFALRGGNFDGNKFALTALSQGAAAVVSDSEEVRLEYEKTKGRFNETKPPFDKTEGRKNFFFCRDSLEMLQRLAAHHRKQLPTTIIGISGTNGKTTTKELIHAVLSSRFRTQATQGNLNNHIGVPLTLLSISPQTEVAIVEMGANHPGEIAFLCRMAQPDMGILTNIGTAHIEGFKTRENIIETKKALFESVKHGNSPKAHLFVNADDPALCTEDFDKKTTYSLNNPSDMKAEAEHSCPYATIRIEGIRIQSQLIGGYNAYNMLAAYTIGRHFGIKKEEICRSIEQYKPSNQRSQILKTDNNTLILDCYNANPSSCKAAIEALADMEAKHKRVFMGAMRELGDVSEEEHEHCLELMKSKNFEQIALVGKEYEALAGSDVPWFETSSGLREYLLQHPCSDCLILIKGSRSTKMEIIEDVL